jgi:hypothetical protein
MNRMREMKQLTSTARWTLAGAYLLIGKQEVAHQLVAGLSTAVPSYRELSYTYGSSLRDQAMILEVLTLMGEKVQARKLVDELAEQMASGNWYSTQTTAYVLLAIGKLWVLRMQLMPWNFPMSSMGNRKRSGYMPPWRGWSSPLQERRGEAWRYRTRMSGAYL